MYYIELFSGAGGLSEGFIKAGFKPIAHIEMDKNSCCTLKTRHAYHYLKKKRKLDIYQSYLKKEISREDLYSTIPDDLIESIIETEITENNLKLIFNKIKYFQKSKSISDIDLIIGGPPCQAYSTIGRAATKNKKSFDLRNYLYQLYGRFLLEFKPKLFLFENVPGIKTAGNGQYYCSLKDEFRNFGYEIEDRMQNAADYGVIQRRERVIIIGWRKDIQFRYPEFENIENKWTVKDILFDLPELKAGESINIGKYISKPSEYIKMFNIRNGSDILTQHIARPHNKKDLRIYKLAIEKWNKNHKRIMNFEIPDKIRTQKNISSFLDRFKVVSKDDLSHTLIAHIAKDGHHYIHPDIEQLRSISIREAARIQSFEDNYYFEGPRTSIFNQIGNAVPPLLSYAIASKIRDIINV